MTTMTAVRSVKDLNNSEILGFLEFHSITDLRVHTDRLKEMVQDVGLDPKIAPDKIQPHDAYRRATKRAESSIEIKYNGKDVKAKLLVREFKTDANVVVRHLVREVADETDEDFKFVTVGKFVFQRKSGTMDISWESGYLNEYPYNNVMKDISNLYTEWTEFHTRDTVSNIVRNVIQKLNHVAIMPNGKATFIPRNQRYTIEALQELVENLKPYHVTNNESRMELIPVIDTIEQRNSIGQRAEEEIAKEADQLMADFAGMLDSDSFDSVKIVQRFAERVTALQIRSEEYIGLTSRKMDVLQNQLADAMKKIMDQARANAEASES